LREADLQGYKFFTRIRGLLDALHGCAAHRNRLLHYDEYAALVLFYFFNPALTSLRGLQRASEFAKVQQRLGLRRMSLGSMSESVRLFDPERLARVFEELAGAAPERPGDPRLQHLQQIVTVADGSLFRALPRMVWAVWLGDTDRAVKAHVQFEVLKGVPARLAVTPGQGAEIAALGARLEAGRLYVLDRGYRSFDLLQAIGDAGSSFVLRLGENAVYECLEEKAITPEAAAARVSFDAIVRLGGPQSGRKLDRPVRLVRLSVPASAPRGLGYPLKRVHSKKTFRRPPGEAHEMLIVTDRLDLPADVIARLYQYRWQVELFFRLLKCVFGCRHLLSDSYNGVSIQLYAALIATLLLAEYTGQRPTKRSYELVALYLQGWVSDDELRAHLARLPDGAAKPH
jgi:hypothetical protein